MERRLSLFVSRKNALTWIAAVLALASAVCRIVFECTNAVPCENIWTHIGAGNGIGAFEHNAAYSGCQNQNGGDPGQRVFAADK